MPTNHRDPTPPPCPAPMRRCLATVALLLGAAPLAGAADALDCGVPGSLNERFMSADCAGCWQATPPAVPGDRREPVLDLDWVVPGRQGASAPLAIAALPEATARATRAGPLSPDETLVHLQPLRVQRSLRVTVEDGPGWNGYLAAQLRIEVDARLAPGRLAAYLALAEEIPAGEDGSPVARRLVRSVVGPLPLDGLAPGHPAEFLRAMRLPETPRPERLRAVGWVESEAGRPIAAALRRLPACGAARPGRARPAGGRKGPPGGPPGPTA